MADAPACPSYCEGKEETDEAQWEEEDAPWQGAAEWVERDLVSHGSAAVPVMGEDPQWKEAATLRAEGKPASQVYPILTARNLVVTAQDRDEREEPTFDRTVSVLPVYREPAWTVWNVPVSRDDPVRGPQDALVTIVQFAEFQCIFSKIVATTLTQILDRYGRDVRIVWKDNPLDEHPRARPAANFARAVYTAQGNEGFWKAHDALFKSQHALQDDVLKAIAKRKGMPWGAIEKAIRNDGYAKKFQQSQDLATNVQARGTPHFFINGVRVAGAQPFEKFVEVIDNRLAEAKALVAKGIPRARLYEHVIKFGKYAPPGKRPSKGNADARIVITVFSDFECPFSARVNPTLEEVLNQHGKDVRIVWRNLPLPLHPNAALAAEAAHEVFLQKGDEAFWQYHDKLFAAQKSPGGLERRKLEDFAAELGVDRTRFRNALDGRAHQEVVGADVRAAREADISGTPSFLINGSHVSGAKPYSVFRRAIQDAMSHR